MDTLKLRGGKVRLAGASPNLAWMLVLVLVMFLVLLV